MAESTQQVLSRVRPPRVQITYDVEIGGAIEKKQLPFIVGLIADLSGQPRRFVLRRRMWIGLAIRTTDGAYSPCALLNSSSASSCKTRICARYPCASSM